LNPGEVSAQPSRDQELAQQRREQVSAAVKTWSGQLTDLGGRNQLLYYRDLKVGTLDLSDAAPLAVDALMDGRTISLSRLFQPDVLPDRLKRARAIRNKAREALEERGIATCFIAVGMATWRNTQGAAIPAAPVLLREASIAAVGAAEDDFQIALTGETDVNPTLLHMLSEQFEVSLPEDLDELIPSGQFDPQPVFDRVRKEAAAIPGFDITPRRVLGTFSYAKLPMVEDLKGNLEALIAHDVVAAIAGNRPAQLGLSTAGNPVDLTDPDRRPPADEFLVLDADSSQSYAINAAVSGQSILVSGPPGTGKSQTIANLIASLVARGQSVLFVAEKRAAIAAVLDRLARVGLANLVLDLHDGAGSRRALAESLAAGLRAAAGVARPDQSELHERLVTRRNRLNDHDDAMHRRRAPWDVSVFEAQCALIGLLERHGAAVETDVRLRGSELAALDGVTMRSVSRDLYEFAGLGGLTLTRSDSLWADAHIVSAEQAEAALRAANRLETSTAPDTRQALDAVLLQTGLAVPSALGEWASVLTLLDRVAATLGCLRPEVFSTPVAEMVAATGKRSWRKQHRDWPGARAGWGERRQTRKAAKQFWCAAGRPSRHQLHSALLEAHDVASQWGAHALDGGTPRLPAALLDVHGRFDQLTRELAALGAYLSGTDFAAMPTADVQSALTTLTRDERTLRKMPRLNELAGGFQRAGLDPLIADLRLRRMDATSAVATLEVCWYRSILERAGFDDPAIANFNGRLHDTNAETFRTADTQHISQATLRVRRAAAEWLVTTRDTCDDQSALVQAQAARKRGHLPIRQLFSAAPDVMTALKPCWAMSPLVVSQLLPGDRPYFDVVVFDEASQIVPADAIPAILRGRRVVVAGDRHQLPPTNFFAAASDGDSDLEQAVNDDGSINLALTSGYESILDVLSAGLGDGRSRSLTWHYRSHDERLIAFSNAWIYDNSLTTFPGVAGGECLSHELVTQQPSAAGQEDSVTAEVDRVVALILDHARARPDESLGVITMGIKHADRIDARLHERLREHPELHDYFDESAAEKFFVKNLERVQGDERDAIILSIGYGKTADGRLPYRFGPLLQDGGHRRLNVAVTRARSRMMLVSSFSHHDMDPNRSKAAGVNMLRAYLQYAASGGENLGDIAPDKPTLNPFEISVRDRLIAAGIPLVAQYGVAGYWIDFAAAHPTQPGRMVLAIEADGASYHSSNTARDRDRLRQEQLERLGWSFHRIWSTDWFADAETCVAKARMSYDHAVAAANASISEGSPGRRPHGSLPPVPPSEPVRAQDGHHRGPRPYVRPGLPITAYTSGELVAIIRWIESDTLLRTEDQLFEEFMSELGFQRRGSRIRAAFDQVLPMSRRA
jgi:very-short-patch-repair endonuclease/DNA polymerase III delta prime subunit